MNSEGTTMKVTRYGSRGLEKLRTTSSDIAGDLRRSNIFKHLSDNFLLII